MSDLDIWFVLVVASSAFCLWIGYTSAKIKAADEIKALRAERDWWQGAAKGLAEREEVYRYARDVLGTGDTRTGRAWDLMHRQGDRIRQALKGTRHE